MYKGDKKYLYIFHFAPNACPRCEAPLNNIFNKLSDVNSAKIICAETRNYNFGKQYILTNFKGNEKSSLIDTTQYLRKIIDHTTTKLSVPFIYKIEISTNKILAIEPILGIKDETEFISKLLNDTIPMECHISTNVETNSQIKNSYRETYLLNTLQNTIEDFSQFKIFDNKIFILEYLTNNILIFNLKGEFLQKITKNGSELTRFIKASDSVDFRNFVKIGLAKNIYLDFVYNNNAKQVTISNSLPEIILTVTNNFKDTNVGYFNKPTITIKDFGGNLITSNSIKFKDTLQELMTSHASIFPVKNSYACPIYKGFPVIGTSEEELSKIECNPFVQSFYDYCPTFEIADTSKSYGFFGTLPSIYKKFNLGYYYSNIKLVTNKTITVQYDLFSGEVNIYNGSFSKPFKSFCLFPNKHNSIAKKDTSTYSTKLDYLNSYNTEMFNSFIYDCKIKNDQIHFVCKNTSDIIYYVFNLNGKQMKQRTFKQYNFNSIKSIRLVESENQIRILTLEKIKAEFLINYLN